MSVSLNTNEVISDSVYYAANYKVNDRLLFLFRSLCTGKYGVAKMQLLRPVLSHKHRLLLFAWPFFHLLLSHSRYFRKRSCKLVQVSDRFHLLKSLTDASKKYISGLVTANFGVLASASHYDGTALTDYWDKDTKEDFPTREHNANCEKKINLANKARKLEEQGYKPGRIAEELGISYPTVKRYLSLDFNPVHGLYNTTINSKKKPCADAIKEMLGKGRTFKEIEVAIRKDGYDGAASTIRMFTTRERNLLKEAKADGGGPVEKIERKWLISLLYKPVDRVKGITQVQLDKVC